MHVGKSYGLLETLYWTRRKAYLLVAGASVVGFKNAQTFNRTVEAQ